MSEFAEGDLVMFKSRCQVTTGGMRVEQVDSSMFDTRLKVNGQWWLPACFISHDEWLRKQAAR